MAPFRNNLSFCRFDGLTVWRAVGWSKGFASSLSFQCHHNPVHKNILYIYTVLVRQLWLFLGVKLMGISKNLLSRYNIKQTTTIQAYNLWVLWALESQVYYTCVKMLKHNCSGNSPHIFQHLRKRSVLVTETSQFEVLWVRWRDVTKNMWICWFQADLWLQGKYPWM